MAKQTVGWSGGGSGDDGRMCPHASTETRWEAAARTRWGSYITKIERRFLLCALDMANTVGDAMEVGAEGGRWSKMLYRAGWTLTLTDIDPKAIDVCRARLPRANCILVNSEDESLPIGNTSVDLVICIEVPTVIRQEWFVSEATRVLRPGGFVVGVFHNRRSFRGFVQHLRSRVKRDVDFYATSYAPWRRRIQARGFCIVKEEGFCWFPFGRESNAPFIDCFTWLERHLGLRKLPTLSPWVALIARKDAVDRRRGT